MSWNAIVERLHPDDWDRAIEPLPERTVFHSRAWLESVCSTYGYRLVLACAKTNGNVVAAWPATETRKGPFRILGSPLPGTSTPYLGPLFARDLDIPAILGAFVRDRALGRYSFFACRTQDEHRTVNLGMLGFTKLLRFETYVVDLALPEEQRWAALKSECRNRIRKATKSKVEVRLETGSEFIDDFWDMAVAVFQRQNRRPTYSKRFVEAAWAALSDEGRICVPTAWHNGRRIATLVLPHDEHTMYYWAGASNREYSKLAPNNLLHWEAIREAARRGLKRYDFISSKGEAGRFKRTFGPSAVLVDTHWEHGRNTIIRGLKRVYEWRLRERRRIKRGPLEHEDPAATV